MSANTSVRLKCTFSTIVNSQQQQRWQKRYAKLFYRQYCQLLTRVHTASLCALYFSMRGCCCSVSSALPASEQRHLNAEENALANNTERKELPSETSSAVIVTHSSQLIEPSKHSMLHNMAAEQNETKAAEFSSCTYNVYHNIVNNPSPTQPTSEPNKYHSHVDKANVNSKDVAQAESFHSEDAFGYKEVNGEILEPKHDVSRSCEEKLSLEAALFGVTDMKTSVVTHVSAAERITKWMPLLESWVKEELFVESNWVNVCKLYEKECAKLQDNNAKSVNVNSNELNAIDANANRSNVSTIAEIVDVDCSIDNRDDVDDDSEDSCLAKTVHYTHSIHNELLNDTKLFVNVIARPKLIRILLLRYLAHPRLWRDSADEVLQLAAQILIRNFQRVDDDDDTNRGKCSKDSVSSNKEIDEEVSRLIDGVKTYFAYYLNQPVNKFNFYTPALFDKLVSFLEANQIEFCDTNALWDAFVIYNRADTSILLSPQRPPFSFGELHPTIATEDLHMVELHGDSNSCFVDNTTVQNTKTESFRATPPSESHLNNIDSTCTSSDNCSILTQTNKINGSSNNGSSNNNEKRNAHDNVMSESPYLSDIDGYHKQNTIESIDCSNSNTVNDVNVTAPAHTNLTHTLSAASWEQLNEYKQNEILFGKAAAELSLRLRPQNGLYVVHYSNTNSSDEYGSSEYVADTTNDNDVASASVNFPNATEVQTVDTCTTDIHNAESGTDIDLNKKSNEQKSSVEGATRKNGDEALVSTSSTPQITKFKAHHFTSQNNETANDANAPFKLNMEIGNAHNSKNNDDNCKEGKLEVNAECKVHCNNNEVDENKENINSKETDTKEDVGNVVKSMVLSSNNDDLLNSANTLEETAKEHDAWVSADHMYDIDRLLCSIVERYFDTERSETSIGKIVAMPVKSIVPANMEKNVNSNNVHSDGVDKDECTQTQTITLQKQVDLKYSRQQQHVHKVIGWGLSENATNGKTNKTNTGTSKKRRQRALRELYYTNAHISSSGEQGEIEDVQLSKLWDAFTKTEKSELISIYYDVHHRFESIKREICIELLAQSILLLLFFARDEVRAITAPDKTYYQLWYLHAEIARLIKNLSRTCEGAFTRERCNENTEELMSFQEKEKEEQLHQRQQHHLDRNENQLQNEAKCEEANRWCVPRFESLPHEVQLSYTCFGVSHVLGKDTQLANEQNKTNITPGDSHNTLEWSKWENQQMSAEQEEVEHKQTEISSALLPEQRKSKSVSPFDLFCSLLKVYECKSKLAKEQWLDNFKVKLNVDSDVTDCNSISEMSNEQLRKWFDSLTFVQRKAIEFCFHDANALNVQMQEQNLEEVVEHIAYNNNLPKSSLTFADTKATISPLLPSHHNQLHSDKECETQLTKLAVADEEEESEKHFECKTQQEEKEEEQENHEEHMEEINKGNANRRVETNGELLECMQMLEKKLKHSVIVLVKDVLYNFLENDNSKCSAEHKEKEEEKITNGNGVSLNECDAEYINDIRELMTCINELAGLSSELQNNSSSTSQINNKLLLDVISTACTKHILPLITSALQELTSTVLQEEQQPVQENLQSWRNETESCKSSIHENTFVNDVRTKRKYTRRLHLDKQQNDSKKARRTRRSVKQTKTLLHQRENKLKQENQKYQEYVSEEENPEEEELTLKHKKSRKYERKKKKVISEKEELPPQPLYEEEQEEKIQRKGSAHCKIKRQSRKITECHNAECSNNKKMRSSLVFTKEELQEHQSEVTPTPLVKNKRQRTTVNSNGVNNIAKTQNRKRKGMLTNVNKNNVDEEESLIVTKLKRQYVKRAKRVAKSLNGEEVENNLSASFSAKEITHHRLREGGSNNTYLEQSLDAQDADDYQEISLEHDNLRQFMYDCIL